MEHRDSYRIDSLSRRLSELQVDAMLVTDEINVRYLSGFTGDSSYLLVESGQTTILTDGRYQTQIANECPNLQTAIRPPSQAMNDLVKEFYRRNKRFTASDLNRPRSLVANFRAAE